MLVICTLDIGISRISAAGYERVKQPNIKRKLIKFQLNI